MLHAFLVEIANLADELESRFLGICLIFKWPAPEGFVVIHENDGPPTSVVIVSNADLDFVLLHVRASISPLPWGALKAPEVARRRSDRRS
jgi:hypothetical protein